MKSLNRIARTWSIRSGWTVVSVVIAFTLAACSDAVAPLNPTEVQSPDLRLARAFSGKKLIPNQYIVVLKSGVAASEVRGHARRLLQSPDQETGFIYTSAIKGFSARMTAAQAAKLANDPNGSYVEQDLFVDQGDYKQSTGKQFNAKGQYEFSRGKKVTKPPFKRTIKVKATQPKGSFIEVRARAFIKVHHGKTPKKSVRVRIPVCP